MIKVSRKTHQTGFIISSFRLSTEVFFLEKNWELFAFSFLWLSPIKLCKAREYSTVYSWANGLCHREQDICRFSFCLEKNVTIQFSCFYEILYFSYAEISLKNKKEQWFDILEGAKLIYIFSWLVQFVLIILISVSCFAPGLCILEYPENKRQKHHKKERKFKRIYPSIEKKMQSSCNLCS